MLGNGSIAIGSALGPYFRQLPSNYRRRRCKFNSHTHTMAELCTAPPTIEEHLPTVDSPFRFASLPLSISSLIRNAAFWSSCELTY